MRSTNDRRGKKQQAALHDGLGVGRKGGPREYGHLPYRFAGSQNMQDLLFALRRHLEHFDAAFHYQKKKPAPSSPSLNTI